MATDGRYWPAGAITLGYVGYRTLRQDGAERDDVVVGTILSLLAGGIIGALIGWNIPEERVKRYESGINEGGILMGVKPRSEEDASHFESSWKDYRGEDVYR